MLFLIYQVYGDKDTDGFYRGEVKGRMGLIPCNMVSEIRADDEDTMDQLIKQGFLPLSTPVDRIGTTRAYTPSQISTMYSFKKMVRYCERKHVTGCFLLKCRLQLPSEQNRRGLRRDQASRRMVALYDYDPRESSPNVDVEVLFAVKDKLLNA